MLWAKHYVGMVTDDKFAAAAEIAAVSPLLPPVLFSALFERAAENGDGSIAGFQPRVFAAKFRVAVEEIERTLAAFAELAILAGDRLVNWAKRQGAAVVAAAHSIARKVSTPRVRKHRERRQGELLLPIAGVKRDETPDETHETRFGNTEERRERERSLEPEIRCLNTLPSLEEGDCTNNSGVSRRSAPLDPETTAIRRNKRFNMIKTLRRWLETQNQPDRVERLAMLGRAEYSLDDWDGRSLTDKHALDRLKLEADRRPLNDQMTRFFREASRGNVYSQPQFQTIADAAHRSLFAEARAGP